MLLRENTPTPIFFNFGKNRRLRYPKFKAAAHGQPSSSNMTSSVTAVNNIAWLAFCCPRAHTSNEQHDDQKPSNCCLANCREFVEILLPVAGVLAVWSPVCGHLLLVCGDTDSWATGLATATVLTDQSAGLLYEPHDFKCHTTIAWKTTKSTISRRNNCSCATNLFPVPRSSNVAKHPCSESRNSLTVCGRPYCRAMSSVNDGSTQGRIQDYHLGSCQKCQGQSRSTVTYTWAVLFCADYASSRSRPDIGKMRWFIPD